MYADIRQKSSEIHAYIYNFTPKATLIFVTFKTERTEKYYTVFFRNVSTL